MILLTNIIPYVSLNNASLLSNQLLTDNCMMKNSYPADIYDYAIIIWLWDILWDLFYHPHPIYPTYNNFSFILSSINLDRYFFFCILPFSFLLTSRSLRSVLYTFGISSRTKYKKNNRDESWHERKRRKMKWEWISLLNVPFSLSIRLTRCGRKWGEVREWEMSEWALCCDNAFFCWLLSFVTFQEMVCRESLLGEDQEIFWD